MQGSGYRQLLVLCLKLGFFLLLDLYDLALAVSIEATDLLVKPSICNEQPIRWKLTQKEEKKNPIFCYGSWTLECQNGSVALQRFGSVKQYFYVFQIQIIISVLNHCRSPFSWGEQEVNLMCQNHPIYIKFT